MPSAGAMALPEAADKRLLPELVFCLCAAVGTDTGEVTDAISSELRSVGYEPVPIRLSQLMSELPGFEHLSDIVPEDQRIRAGMDAGNEIRKKMKANEAVAILALGAIQSHRADCNADKDVTVPAEGKCFIISSLKRSEEIEMIRKLFGQRSYLISVYEPRQARIENLCRKIARSRQILNEDAYVDDASTLIDIDQKERSSNTGQRLEDVFPLADFFLKAGPQLRTDARRFVQLVFGAPYITPTSDEFLMFQAKATAQRSADLSRQVGAIIATERGEILAAGCNEVPRAGGGVNWDDVANTDLDYRDYKIGYDSAANTKMEIVSDVFEELKKAGWLNADIADETPETLATRALFEGTRPLAGTMVASLLEFGRIVHAEMAAICDASMRGVSVKGAILFCTTFPCHMCARHVVAAGISRVVYIEPYPKSRAKKLYRRAIQVDEDREADPNAVKFDAFVGVSPSRFLDLFSFVPRKDERGYALAPTAPQTGPKGVAFASLASELEATYLASLKRLERLEPESEPSRGERDDQPTATVANDGARG
ncbi:anti-phage dCTP deaminase [Methylobacterium sp. NEAU 140]|uniref:anti-phage dCTP deaminase n=1 Tax=Methylobacterium sp. NEAU 140 TaxID=3064945 RepID=UPI0027333F7B|nr:anti-phage dCTP deaminase [Methylobacterium sp. NEAU 140]MDP4024051.1 anti-phage dCTP deaminase [Methylobacterium sp. NEAU 140]